MGVPVELFAGLIEGEMTVGTDAEDLKLNGASGDNCAELLYVCLYVAGAFCDIGVVPVNINMIEKIGIHEVSVALVMRGFKAYVLVEVNGADFRKVKSLLAAAACELLIHADWAGARGEAKAAVGLLTDDFLNYIRTGGALAGIILAYNYFQGTTSCDVG